MNKQVQAIRAEIERQLEYFKGKEYDAWDDCDRYTDEDVGWYQGHWKMCTKLLAFIDSLPEEPMDILAEKCPQKEIDPDVARAVADHFFDMPEEHIADGKVEEAAEEYRRESFKKSVMPQIDGPANEYGGSIKDAFIAGAEWQKEQDQPITGNSLEQEWLRYVDKKKKENRGELPALGEYGWLMIARHFAKWQKEQMMKEAVDAKVVKDTHGFFHIKSDCVDGAKYKFGEWVKIIILKDDGKVS